MSQTVGVQINPFSYLRVTPNANSAHITQLGGDWETFYRAKRSSATRWRDRAKRKRMSEYGEIRFVTATEPDDARHTLEILMDQRAGHSRARESPPYLRGRDTGNSFSISRGTTWAAANFAIAFGDYYYHVLASYCDGELTRYGPGALHLRELLAYAIKLGLRRFDFTIGDERYKLEWSDLRLKLCDHSGAAA